MSKQIGFTKKTATYKIQTNYLIIELLRYYLLLTQTFWFFSDVTNKINKTHKT